MTTQIELAALDGGGKPIALRADQNTDTSIALRASLEVGGVAVSPAAPVPVVSASGITITQTTVVLQANIEGPLIVANPLRRYLALQVLFGGDVLLGFPTATSAAGWRMSAGGPPLIWDGHTVPLQAIGGASSSDATVIILEGV